MITKMFNKFLIKGLVVSAVLLGAAFQSSAFTVSTNAMAATGVWQPIVGGAKITQVIILSAANNTAALLAYDAATNQLSFVVGAYTNIVTYQTNLITTYTNWYGATNSFTNIAQVEVSNPVAQSTNFYPLRMSMAAATNTTVRFDNVNYYFQNGVLFTNSGAGAVSITVTYQQ